MSSCDFFEDDPVGYDDCTNIDLAVIWNGLSSIYPSTGTDNPVATKIRQDTKINVNFNFYDGNENDNLMHIFAIGKIWNQEFLFLMNKFSPPINTNWREERVFLLNLGKNMSGKAVFRKRYQWGLKWLEKYFFLHY